MDPTTASYYRAAIYCDLEDTRPIPPSLCKFHAFVWKRYYAMGCGSQITKQIALSTALLWMSSTPEGREFACEETPIGEFILKTPENTHAAPFDAGDVDWKNTPLDTPVEALSKNGIINGTYAGRTAAWIYVTINNERMSFRPQDVRLAATVGV